MSPEPTIPVTRFSVDDEATKVLAAVIAEDDDGIVEVDALDRSETTLSVVTLEEDGEVVAAGTFGEIVVVGGAAVLASLEDASCAEEMKDSVDGERVAGREENVVGGTVVGETVVNGTVLGAAEVGATVVGGTVVGGTIVGEIKVKVSVAED